MPMPQHMYGGLRTTRGSQFSPSAMWVPAINLRLSGLAASTHTYGAILPVLCISFQIIEPLLDTFITEATTVIKTKEFSGWGVRSRNAVL